MEASTNNYSNFKPKWQKRFEFFDKFGTSPRSPAYKEAYKQLSFGERITIGQNIIALFFGWVYFFVLGLWRKNLILLLIIILLSVLIVALPEIAQVEVSAGVEKAMEKLLGGLAIVLYGSIANRAYYLHKVKGSKSWNPFEGF